MTAVAAAEGVVIPIAPFTGEGNRRSFELEYSTRLPEVGHRFDGRELSIAVGSAIVADGVIVDMERRYAGCREAGLRSVVHPLYVDGNPGVDAYILFLGASSREQATRFHGNFTTEMNRAYALLGMPVSLAIPGK